MKHQSVIARCLLPAVLSLVTVAFLTLPVAASIGNIVASDLAGNWMISMRGTTGCGFVDMEADVTINSSGAGTGTLTTHGVCGDTTAPGQTFTINSLQADGSGTATLTCGTSCGWDFNIQVSPDRSKFNLVDFSSKNPGNYLEGVAILQSPSGNIGIADLTGSWQLTLFGSTGCGVGTTVANFTLNNSGVASDVSETYHTTGCGDGSASGYIFTILSLDADGYGTANLNCGPSCGWNFDIQVSPDRSTFNVVDVSTANPSNFQAGVAINDSTASVIVAANLQGNWQLAEYGQNGCGISSTLVTFTMNTSGLATNATEYNHTAGCGNSKGTGNTFTITSLNVDGSGTATLSCGTNCGYNYAIQVSPDRSVLSLVDVSSANPGNFQVATAFHQ
jgi:hypothetical protein